MLKIHGIIEVEQIFIFLEGKFSYFCPPFNGNIMPKKPTRRELNLLKKTDLRNQRLKQNAPTKGKKTTLEESNRAILNSFSKK